MKRNPYLGIVLALFSMFVVGAQAFGSPALYDNFSGPYIDNEKWDARELVREVVDGKLVSKVGNSTSNMHARNNTPFENPSSIHAIQCDITMVETVLDTGTPRLSFARIDGRFYNTLNSGTQKGDVWAAVHIGDRGSGLEAWWEIVEVLDDEGNSWQWIASDKLLTGALSYGTAYTTKIEYNETNSQFTFTVAGVSSGPVAVPAKLGAEFLAYKALETGAYADGGSGTGYASAMFENVYINNEGTVYDDFSSPWIDQIKWQASGFVREISDDGKLRLEVNAWVPREVAAIYHNNQATPYLEAKVLVKGESRIYPCGTGIVRIGGWYYNDSRGPGSGQPYDGNEGDVWVDIRIILIDRTLEARSTVWRSDVDPNGPGTSVDMHYFGTSIVFDTEYTLSIEFTGSTIIFTCGTETYEYDLLTPAYPPSQGQLRQMLSRVDPCTGWGESIKATFDDVYVGAPGSISGQVIDEDGPIEGIRVNAFGGPCRKTLLGGAYTDQNGIYTIENVPPSWGLYVETCAKCDHLNYIDEWWDDSDGTTNCYVAVPVQVTEGAVTEGINFSLGPVLIEFEQINTDGFGDPENTRPDGKCTFADQVYVGTVNDSGGQLWRYSDGTTWESLIEPGFGNTANIGIETASATFNNYFYAGTINFSTGAELWRSSDGENWDPVFSGGLSDPSNYAAWTSNCSGFNGALYVQLNNNVTGGIEIWRSESADGTPGEWEQVTPVGFEDSNNVWGIFYQIDGSLYYTLQNKTTGAQIWKTANGTDWFPVTVDGFGDSENFMVRLTKFKGQFYASTRNLTGGEVWRSADGTNWELIIDEGFGNPYNVYMQMYNPVSSEDFLYIGTYNDITGGELWRTFDGVTWSQLACCGFGDVNNVRLRPLTLGNELYIACDNFVTGIEVWKAIPNTSSGGDVVIEPVDDTTGTTPVTITFDQIDEEGTTSLVILPEGDPEPPGFKLGDPPTYYEITTTAEISGDIEVCIDYSGISYGNENELRFYHYENDQWVDVTTSLDTANDIICGTVSSLSLFAILEPENTIEIDIKPGSYPNYFNQNEHGVIPVAIFGSAELDVNDINLESLSLRGLVIEMVGKHNKYLAHYEYVNEDDYLDLVVQFEDSDGWIESGSDYVTLSGQMLDGTYIYGRDTISIVP